MGEQPTCPVCGENVAVAPYTGGNSDLTCPRCGKYSVSTIANHEISFLDTKQRTNLSGWIREHQGARIDTHVLKGLVQLKTPTVGEKAEKLLSYLSRIHPKPGEKIAIGLNHSMAQFIDTSTDRPKSSGTANELMGVTWAQDETELSFLISDYLQSEQGFLEMTPEEYYRITPKGWAHLDSLRQENSNSRVGFIAMSFHKSMDSAHVAIETAIRNSGYEPLRIDRKEHNNKIDDEIVAGIRRSKFLVADFTGHRGGVYFEAGFAMGMGIPVIWLCREDDLKDLHFDTRQYNHISWTEANLSELANALQKRIEAILGRGPLG